MAKVSFKRVESINDLNSIDIEDGNFIITGDSNAFIDYGSKRIPIGGTPDNQMDDSSTNSVQNKIIKKYIDDKTSTNSKNIEELKESNIYSTEEKVIGKWINGKTIYRKVLSGTKASIKDHLNQSEIGYETVIKAYGIMYSIWGNWWHFPTYFTDSAYFIVTYYTTERIVIEHGANYNDDSPIRFIIEYTKTTDEVVE